MGCGKTSVGRVIAENTNYKFIDIDTIIEEREQVQISEIFKSQGEPYFRKLEADTIKEFSQYNNQVISTGGGAIENLSSLDTLSNSGYVFYLYATTEELFNRLTNEMSNRPMLKDENPKEKLNNLLIKREPNYLKANYKINTINKSIQEVANEIIEIYDGVDND